MFSPVIPLLQILSKKIIWDMYKHIFPFSFLTAFKNNPKLEILKLSNTEID